MRRAFVLSVCAAALIGLSGLASAGSPHFVSTTVTSVTSTSLTVQFKEAGLGDESQVQITVQATAECINGGSNHPKATNKEGDEASGTFAVNNGQATGAETVTTTLSCSPPMTIAWTDVKVVDDGNHISTSIPRTFSAS